MIYDIHYLVCANGVVQVEPQVSFRIFVAKVTNVTKRIVSNQVVLSLLPHPEKAIPSHLSFVDLVGPEKEPHSNYQYQESLNRQTETD